MQVDLTPTIKAIELPEQSHSIELLKNGFGNSYIWYKIGHKYERPYSIKEKVELLGVIKGGVMPVELKELFPAGAGQLKTMLTSKAVDLSKVIVIIKVNE